MKKGTKIRPTRRSPRTLVNVGQYTYTVIITPNDPDGYLVTCPALPGVVTQGDTFDEARAMAADAITCHLESMIEDGQVVPQTAPKKPAKVEVSDAEFRHRLKNISDWRKKRLAQLHSAAAI